MEAGEAQALIREGIAALQRRDGPAARSAFERVIEAAAPVPPPWFLLAQACRQTGDSAAEAGALDQVLASQPRNIGALIMRGDLYSDSGDRRAAVSFYSTALRAAAQEAQLSPVLAGELDRAREALAEAEAEFAAALESSVAQAGGGPRVLEALDVMLGRKEIYLQQPTSFYFPGLPQRRFYEREEFPWIGAVEAAAPAIRAELEAVLADRRGFEPYVLPHPDRPLQTNPLLGDPSWSAFHLFRQGEPVPGNAERCPSAIAALRKAPMPAIRGRSPMALFSVLRAGAHIAPHNGLLNTRLICHLPLIVPPGCSLRVGSETRDWQEGKCLIFDDSIEHEAWNRSDRTRVILLFEIWRPEIGEAERAALTAMFETITDYRGAPEED
jgi:hypothetical protein